MHVEVNKCIGSSLCLYVLHVHKTSNFRNWKCVLWMEEERNMWTFRHEIGKTSSPSMRFFLLGIFQCVKAKAYTCFHTQNHDVEIILSPPKKWDIAALITSYMHVIQTGRHHENLQEVRAEVMYPKTRVTCGLWDIFQTWIKNFGISVHLQSQERLWKEHPESLRDAFKVQLFYSFAPLQHIARTYNYYKQTRAPSISFFNNMGPIQSVISVKRYVNWYMELELLQP